MYETEEESGITHFFEHISIRNVNKLMGGTLYSELDRRAVEFNASTYSEMVQFYISGASKNFSFGADVITRLFSPIVLGKDEIDTERRRIKAEIRESDDKNSLLAFSNGIVHKGTSLARQITGTAGSVTKITARSLEKYRKSVFNSENVFFYITGNFTDSDVDYLAGKIEEHTLSSGTRVHDNIAPTAAEYLKRGGEVSVKNSDFTSVRFTFDLDMQRVGVPETDLIYDMLLSGYNSRFFIEMSENRGMFYDISGAVERYRNAGELYFSYDVRERDIIPAIEMTVEILNDFKSRLFDEGEIMKCAYVDNADMLYDDARELNFTMAYDNHIMNLGYASLDERKAAYERVTPEAIRRAACEIFSNRGLTVTLKGKRKKINVEKIKEIISKLK
ncbi:MAG: insulinase family protein [Clostridia bacterium]|nr:insulinase family protein [Clostridia bacterium]